MSEHTVDLPKSPGFACPRCEQEFADPQNPYCEKCDIAWVECPGCQQWMQAGHGTCEACGYSVADKG